MARHIFLAVVLALLLSGCVFSAPPSPTPTAPDGPTPTPVSRLLEQIELHEQRWQEQAVQSYHIEVTVSRSTWHVQIHEIVVRKGHVEKASATCNPAPAELGKCKAEPFDAQDYLVPASLSWRDRRPGTRQAK